MIGLLALGRTAGEGAAKYGRYNYLQGMPVHDLLDHAFRHLILYTAGDRTEPHIAHAAWGLLAAIQEEALRPEAHAAHMLGPGCSIGPEMKGELDRMRPILAKKRAEHGAEMSAWSVDELKDVKTLKNQADGVTL